MKNIALVGFMGSGKSTAGPLLAKETGWDFVDLDDLIEERTGKSINAIFERDGEKAFRGYESAALAEIARRDGVVVSCGGGVVTSAKNRRLLSARFHVIYLHLSLPVIHERLRGSSGRPLIHVKEPEVKIKELYTQRLPFYQEVASYTLAADALSPSEIANRITKWTTLHQVETAMSRVPVELGSRSYEIVVGEGAADRLLTTLEALGIGSKRRVVLVSRRVWALWGERLLPVLGDEADVLRIELSDSEGSKSLRAARGLYDKLVDANIDRYTPVIAIGGGVVGDLGAFVASTYMRGLPLVHLPTTLLAQVDSSIGGKTAVNHPRAKNIIGTFYQPRAVLADTRFLSTLPARQLSSGMAEVIKYGFLQGGKLLGQIDASISFLKIAEPARTRPVIAECARVKARVVGEDELDFGTRAILNYGHTVGHAIESASGYKGWTHGEAVAVGMIGAALVARALGMLSEEEMRTHRELIGKAALPVGISAALAAKLMDYIKLDKKSVGGKLMMVLLDGIGKPVVRQVSLPVLSKSVRGLVAE